MLPCQPSIGTRTRPAEAISQSDAGARRGIHVNLATPRSACASHAGRCRLRQRESSTLPSKNTCARPEPRSEDVAKLTFGWSCPRTAPSGARHRALITGDACAPAGAAPFAATRDQVGFATHSYIPDEHR